MHDYSDENFDVELALYAACMKGNIQAIMFWLRRRMPDVWGDEIPSDVVESGVLEELLIYLKEKHETEGV